MYPRDTSSMEALRATAEEVGECWSTPGWSDEAVLQSQGKSAPSDESLFPLLEWFGFLWTQTQQSAPLTSSDISGARNSRCSHAVHVCTFCFLSRAGKHTSSCWFGPLSLLARRRISQHTACLVDIGADVSRFWGRNHTTVQTRTIASGTTCQ